MIDRRTILTAALAAIAAPASTSSALAQAAVSRITAYAFSFPALAGGDIRLADHAGRPLLVVNTASLCGYTPQYTDLQALSDLYGDKAVVLAVPSNDFNQELASEAEVKEFCALNYDLTLPMTTIQHVAKGAVHPFYAWVRDSQGFEPGWNFNKVLIGPDGAFVQAWGSNAKPMGAVKAKMDEVIAAGG